ncbi:hypothetical protein RhiirC2_720963 [Rhizophagus irregularis]|uniref:Uncharacterized protein n=1 Tax=Rhizophagus irregularis TaxID=588596 RepID=A0A2N1M860_9GLOM|nr:hypothetical protein RhiirC2_720963 [Rhizophagus irregularis]
MWKKFKSEKSSSDAAALNLEKKMRYSGPHFFGLHLEVLQQIIDNVQQSIGKGGRRDIINILKYLIPGFLKRKVLDITNPIIYLRISGDGRNVGRKVKQVIVTCSILNDIDNLHQPENYHTIVLYPGIEKYETLHIILDPLIVELRKLKEEGLEDDQGVKWKIELYFSSDWKFLAICLRINAANSKYFCP